MTIIITGVSKGLGQAIAQLCLEKGHVVIGVGRSHSFAHENFSFLACDFNNTKEIEALTFDLKTNEEIVLINNAGIIGEINRVTDQNQSDAVAVFQVNTIAPILLTQKIAKYFDSNPLKIINISSGAGRRSIPSWSSYCASKAALDSFSETFQLEEQEKGKKTKVYSIAPGIIDTAMQEQIRGTNAANFSSLETFKSYKENQELKSPETVANEIYKLLLGNHEATKNGDVICRI